MGQDMDRDVQAARRPAARPDLAFVREPDLVAFVDPYVASKEEAERSRIAKALERHNNNRLRAAADLGISRMTLYNKLRKYGQRGQCSPVLSGNASVS